MWMVCEQVVSISSRRMRVQMNVQHTISTIEHSQALRHPLAIKWSPSRLVKRWKRLNDWFNSRLSRHGLIAEPQWLELHSTMWIVRRKSCKSRLSRKRCKNSSWESLALQVKASQSQTKMTHWRRCSKLMALRLIEIITRRSWSTRHSIQARLRFVLVKIKCLKKHLNCRKTKKISSKWLIINMNSIRWTQPTNSRMLVVWQVRKSTSPLRTNLITCARCKRWLPPKTRSMTVN